MNTVPELRTRRLLLRGITADDRDAVVAVFADPERSRYFAADFSDAETACRMALDRAEQENPEGMGHWAIELDGTLVGIAHLRPSRDLPGGVAEIGWYLHPDHGGRGLATEASRRLLEHAFGSVGLPAVWALVHESNVASLNLARRLGFLDVGSGVHYGDVHRVYVALPSSEGRPHHIELWVPDLRSAEASIGWLLRELGWREYQRWPAGVSWKLGPTYVVVEQSPALADGKYDRLRPGLNHLALHAGTQERIDRIAATAVENGWTLLFGDRHPYAGGPRHYAAYLENKDGFEVELVATTPTSARSGD